MAVQPVLGGLRLRGQRGDAVRGWDVRKCIGVFGVRDLPGRNILQCLGDDKVLQLLGGIIFQRIWFQRVFYMCHWTNSNPSVCMSGKLWIWRCRVQLPDQRDLRVLRRIDCNADNAPVSGQWICRCRVRRWRCFKNVGRHWSESERCLCHLSILFIVDLCRPDEIAV
jgi:hypothetical protein